MSLRDSISSQEMTALELNAEYLGVSPLQLMENAGCAVASAILDRVRDGSVFILSGTGGKGGDGMVAARHLACGGFDVHLTLLGRPEEIRREVVRRNWETLRLMHDSISITIDEDHSQAKAQSCNVVVDALLGTGYKGALRHPYAGGVAAINRIDADLKIAIDLPTGVDPDSGEILGDAVRADLTVTFHKPKRGLFKAPQHVGELMVAPIGIPPEAELHVGPGDIHLTIKPRLPETRKGDYGRLLVIGGNDVFHGAPTLAALAAMRIGIDLTYVAVPEPIAHDVASTSPSLIVIRLRGNTLSPHNIQELDRWISRATAIVFGIGLGLEPESEEATKKIVEAAEKRQLPLLLDADGLKAFSKFKRPLHCPLVLTPHAGEYEILTGERPPSETKEKTEHVKKTAKSLGAVILLKGPVDVISDGSRAKLNRFAHNPGMTVGGTGDILSGIVGAFLSQGAEPFRAAAAGAFINGVAGDFAAEERGYHLLPTDLLEWIPKAMDKPMEHAKTRHRQLSNQGLD